MLKKYADVLIVFFFLMIVVMTSGCYTVLQMRSNNVSQEYCYDDAYDLYDPWYDPFYYYYPYHHYSYVHSYYQPWTYWWRDPYWTYPYYYTTRYSGYDPYDYGSLKWQKSSRRRGFLLRPSSPTNVTSRPSITSKGSLGTDEKSLKKLRKVGTGITSKPARRTGIDRTSTSTSGTISRSSPVVTRQTSKTSSSSSSKASSQSRSSTPAKRRGSQR